MTTNLGWDRDKIRQGVDLAATRNASATSGTIHVKWQISGEIDSIDFGPTTIDTDGITCDPKFSGGGFECEADSPGLPLPGPLPSLIRGRGSSPSSASA